MKKIHNRCGIKKPQLSLLTASVFMASVLVGCNFGGSQSSTVTPNLTTNVHSTTSVSDQTVGLNDVELGWGYDPDTNSVIALNTDPSKLVGVQPDVPNSEAQSVVHSTSSKYSDYGNYSHNAANSSSIDKSGMKAGLGVNYGFFKASMKAALEKSQNEEDSSLFVKKEVGFVNEATSYFNIDTSTGNKVTPLNASRVADAILTANPEIKLYIEKIRNAKTDALKNKAILNFYAAFGTQFISSVTRGYVGFSEITLSQNESSGGSSGAASAEASFSSPFASGGGSFSTASANKFTKSNWNTSFKTFVYPSNPDLKKAVDELEQKLQKTLADQKDIFDFSAFSDPEKNRSTIEFPTVDTRNYEPNADIMKEKQELQVMRKKMIYDLDELENLVAEVQETIEERDAATDVEQKQKFQGLIDTEISSEGALGKTLNKFTFGDYAGENLSAAQSRTLKTARDTVALLKKNKNTSASEIEKLKKSAADDATKEKTKLANLAKLNFTEYLKGIHLKSDKKDIPFKDWYDSLSLTEVKDYDAQFKEDLEKQGLIDKPEATSSVASKIALRKEQSSLKLKVASHINLKKDPDAPVVLNYNIMPWTTIFPELTSQVSSGPTDMIKSKLMKKIDTFLLDQSYLALASRYDQTSSLSDIYVKDQKTVVTDQLNVILKKIEDSYDDGVDANVFSYANKDYNYINDAEKIDAIIDSIIKQSSMAKFKDGSWYKEVTRLRNYGLLNPQGDLATLYDMGDKLIYIDGSAVSSYRLYQDFSRNSKNTGQVLGRFYMGPPPNSTPVTFMPIVLSSGKIGLLSSDLPSNSSLNSACLGVSYSCVSSSIKEYEYPNATVDYRLSKVMLSNKNVDGWFRYMAGSSVMLTTEAGAGANYKTSLHSISQDTLSQMKTEMTEKVAKEKNPRFKLFYGTNAAMGNIDYVNTLLGIY